MVTSSNGRLEVGDACKHSRGGIRGTRKHNEQCRDLVMGNCSVGSRGFPCMIRPVEVVVWQHCDFGRIICSPNSNFNRVGANLRHRFLEKAIGRAESITAQDVDEFFGCSVIPQHKSIHCTMV